EQDLDVRVIILPEGEDPDSYMQSTGLEGFSNYLQAETKDFLLFKAELLLDEESQDMAGKTRVVREMSDSLAKIDSPLKRSEYIKRFAGLLGVREDLLINQVNQAISNRRKELAKEQQREQWKQQREQGRGNGPSLPAGARQAGAGRAHSPNVRDPRTTAGSRSSGSETFPECARSSLIPKHKILNSTTLRKFVSRSDSLLAIAQKP
ncbi:MAG: hypothetical protein AAFO91_14395, partial [Bacteroidota bacterium]